MEDKDNYTVFTQVHDGVRTTVRLDGWGFTLTDMLQHFDTFLRGCGYHYKGVVEILDESDSEE